jgi:hypothetical protein
VFPATSVWLKEKVKDPSTLFGTVKENAEEAHPVVPVPEPDN